MTLEQRLWVTSALCLCTFFVLGYAVTHASSLWRIDAEASVLRSQASPLAVMFTTSGRALPLFLLAAATLPISLLARIDVRIAIAIFVTQLLSQGAAELSKRAFLRERPDTWIFHHELGYSYPSGHAATAIVFFGSWLVAIALLPLPKMVKIGAIALVAAWMIGINWSRLALGAHYFTDVVGGTLFGLAWACALWALLLHFGMVRPWISNV